jgi:di/tricarboxylate transporter
MSIEIILIMVILPILELVTPKEAISGLSSNAVVSIIAVIVIGARLDKTGAMNSLARVLLKFAGKSESRIMILMITHTFHLKEGPAS